MTFIIPQLYKHVQDSAAIKWTVTHNLSSNGSAGFATIDVITSVNGKLMRAEPISVKHISKNVAELNFSTAISGYALVTV